MKLGCLCAKHLNLDHFHLARGTFHHRKYHIDELRERYQHVLPSTTWPQVRDAVETQRH
jgi:hypothetical protein